MKILFVGPDSGTSLHRFRALRELGHETHLIDPRRLLPRTNLIDRVEWKLHPAPLAAWVRPRLLATLQQAHFDLAFIDSGSLVDAKLVRELRRRCGCVVNFNHDDPFGPRDGPRFAAYRHAVPDYDLLVVVRHENVAEARALGARRVLHSFRVADEVAHAQREIAPDLRLRWGSEVAFVGTWMPERGPFLSRVIERGIPLSIFGAGWEKAPEWPRLRHCRRSAHLEGDDYSLAIQCSKICLGLLSSGNRDLHTTRSLEIPALGAVLCAQRTSEHESLYADREEAVFWNDADECAGICRELLDDTAMRKRIAQSGHRRFLSNGHTTRNLLRKILDECGR